MQCRVGCASNIQVINRFYAFDLRLLNSLHRDESTLIIMAKFISLWENNSSTEPHNHVGMSSVVHVVKCFVLAVYLVNTPARACFGGRGTAMTSSSMPSTAEPSLLQSFAFSQLSVVRFHFPCSCCNRSKHFRNCQKP